MTEEEIRIVGGGSNYTDFCLCEIACQLARVNAQFAEWIALNRKLFGPSCLPTTGPKPGSPDPRQPPRIRTGGTDPRHAPVPTPGANPWSAPAPGWVATPPPPNADMGRVDVGGTGPPPVFVRPPTKEEGEELQKAKARTSGTPTREEYERALEHQSQCTCLWTSDVPGAIGKPPCPVHPPKWGG